jgi:hypothetical protein
MKKLLTTAITILGFTTISMSQLPSYVPANGLVGYYPFNENANDESGNGNNGVNNGATLTNDRFGNLSKAYSFDGIDDFIDLTSSNYGINGNSDRSVSAWVKTNAVNVLSVFATGEGVSGVPCTNNGKAFNLRIVNSRLGLMGFDCGTCPTCDFYPSTGGYISDDVWHNLVVILKSDTIYTYVDGTLDNQNYMPTFNTSGNFNFIGKDNHIDISDYFFGLIDDIGIWNRALTLQEISDIYNASNCANDLTISPSINHLQLGSTATFNATSSDPTPSFLWQSDFGQGFQTLNNYGNYSGVNTNALSISSLQLANHAQPIRVISTSGNCIDTSNVATINITDTCIVTTNDTITTLISVTDTLIINTQVTGLTPPNTLNTIKVFPNPANDHITIDYGNFTTMIGYTLKITNVLGQIVFTTPINQQSSYVDLSTWNGNGIYYVQIIDAQNNTIENRKIVLQ